MLYDDYDLILMADELSKLYGKENAKKIMLENKENLFEGKDSVAYSLGKRSMKFFSLYFLKKLYRGDDKAELSPTHFEMWGMIEDMFNGKEQNKLNFILPRGMGKTSMGSVVSAIWSNLYGYSRYTVIGSAVKDTATSFVMTIKEGLTDNPQIKSVWGDMINDNLINTTEKVQLVNDTMITAMSTRTTFRGTNYKGTRINLLILDDYISEENTSSKEAKDKHYNTFVKNALPAVDKSRHWILAFGTTQSKDDFYDRLANDPTFKTMKKPSIDNLDIFKDEYWTKFRDILFDRDKGIVAAKEYYYNNEDAMKFDRVWEYFECVDLAISFFTNESAFRQEMQLEFGTGQTKKFTNINFYDDEISSQVLVIDPATSSKSDADYTAFVVGSMEDDIVYVNHSEIDRLEFEDYIARTMEILKDDEDIETVVVEKQTYNGSDVLAMKNLIQRDCDLRGRGIEFVNNHQTKNKDNKIDSIVGDVNMGRVQFHNDDRSSAAIEQLKDFTSTKSSKHDDYPDALSELVLYLKEGNLQQDNVIRVFDKSYLF